MNFRRHTFKKPFKLSFFKKITVHIVLMTIFTGLAITLTGAHRFRREIYALEHDAAYMVYAALVNFLTAHHHWYNGYVRRSIDFELQQKFMHLDVKADHEISHQPIRVTIFDELGRVRYLYTARPDVPEPRPLSPDALPYDLVLDHVEWGNVIRIAGPVDRLNPDLGYLEVLIPTAIAQQMVRLLLQAAAMLALILSVTLALTLYFTRQVLQPVRALTLAAKAVHRGDLSQRVSVTTDDEIGDLITTFNEMLNSLNRRLEVMHRMQEWTMRIGRQLDQEKLVVALGNMFQRMSMANSYRLYLKVPRSDQLEMRLEHHAEELPVPEDDVLTHQALSERWAMYRKADGSIDNEPVEVVEIAIPLLSGQHRIGVIRIGRKQDDTLYDEDTLTTLQTLAQHASVAIDNTNLYNRLAAQERMAQEMMLARQIQQSMLPRKAPSIKGYDIIGGSTPALEVGGDYFDFVKKDDDCHLFVGDVTGKGVPAALIMSIVRALIHTYLEFESVPVRVLQRVNKSISEDLEPEMFVTMTELALNVETHRIGIARAGHEPVLILRADGEAVHLAPPGSALGLLEPEDFERIIRQETYAMEPGDIVLLYTDGVTEAQNQQGEEFGVARLESILRTHRQQPIEALYRLVLKSVFDFAVGMPQRDDITLVILRRSAEA